MTDDDLDQLQPLTRATQWTCRVCGQDWYVPQLARNCERKDLA